MSAARRPSGNVLGPPGAVDGSGTAGQMRHLFEPFNRLGAEGAGIGLAIVKALTERMGGTVQTRGWPAAPTSNRTWPWTGPAAWRRRRSCLPT